MQKRYLIVNTIFFSVIFSIRILPPFLVSYAPDSAVPLTSADWGTFVPAIFWLCFTGLVAVPYLYEKKPGEIWSTKDLSLKNWLWCIPALAVIPAVSIFWQYVGSRFGLTASSDDSLFLTPFLVAFIAVSAYTEEVLYRRYLPDVLAKFIPRIPADLISILIFALSHRYMGWTASANAFCAAIVFTILRKKTGSVLFTGTVHFLYNLILCLCM